MSAWMSAADMAKDAGAAAEEPRRAWAHAGCVTVPVGQCWDVLRVLEGPGLLAVRILRADDLPLGPLLHLPARGVLEFVVPLGTTRCWPPLDDSRCVEHGMMRWPAPWTRTPARPARCGRRWIQAPPQPPTDADALCEAVGRALHRSRHKRPRIPARVVA